LAAPPAARSRHPVRPQEFVPPPRFDPQNKSKETKQCSQTQQTRPIAKPPIKRRSSQQTVDESDNPHNPEEKKQKTANKAPTEMDQLLSLATSIDKSVEAQQRRFEVRQQHKESKFDRRMALQERQLALAERQAQYGFGMMQPGMMQPGMVQPGMIVQPGTVQPGMNVPGQQPPVQRQNTFFQGDLQ
jgi:hypothetical protein